MTISYQREPARNFFNRIPKESLMAIKYMACPSTEIQVGTGADNGRLESAPTFLDRCVQ